MKNIAYAWSAVGGDPALADRVTVTARRGVLDARLPVREAARACVAVCALAAAELAARRAGLARVPGVRVDDGAVATSFTSERQLLVDGRAPVAFAPLSRFWRTADGWVRTHANYPHHRERLLSALGAGAAEESEVEAALAERSAVEAEEAVYAAGGLAVAVRTPEEWARHPQAAAVAGRPLVERERLGTARARVLVPLPAGTPLLPAAGLRVLDLSRVIAGPVATRTLALLGADVLRVDPPGMPELPDQHTDTGFGKRSAVLDLAAGRRDFEELLAAADVVVTGYRPGALDRFGLSAEALAERRPGLVVAQLSAWGAYGPWGGRRGFDSLVQAATGIAVTEGTPERPGALPAQALDHGSGHLLAAGVLRALTERSYDGYGRVVRVALARTARWLTQEVAADTGAAEGGYDDAGPWLAERDSRLGRLRYALPPVAFAGGPGDWARPPGPWGADPARWA
ncbi:CoA transferase [Streptomyces sp.]|uniref:CoA transferase n=1 Tax=Streptomyces sp. TaxID=1931 RepID=UPI002D4A8479|nr:CoA transferase [Streptomyces sp.]HZF87134.1 CoA transferase [Streptomyces sp.]